MRFAVFANPGAARYREDPDALEALYKVTSSRGLLLTPSTLDQLEEELASLRDEPPEFLACAGGDGTVSRFTTALLRTWEPHRIPPILLLHGGTMNTIAKSIGLRGDAPAQLEAVVRSEVASVARTRRWPIQVGARRWGWLFGAGIIPRYIQQYDATGARGPQHAAATLARLVGAALLGGGRDFFAPTRLDVHVDGRPWPMKHWLLVAAGGVDDLGLRFRPFPGLLQAPGKMGVFASASRPHRFALDLLPFRFNRPARHSLAFHHIGEELRLQGAEPILYNLDGDLETAGTSLMVRSGPPLTFLLPPDARPPRNELGP